MRINIQQWEMLIVLSRLKLIEMLYANEFDDDGKVCASLKVHPEISKNMKK